MNNKICLVTLFAILGAPSIQAASTGTINFTGQVTDSTCDVSVDGQGTTATVALPTVPATELASQGATTGRTNFNMALTNCTVSATDGTSKVAAYFQAGATVDPSTGHLKQTTTTGAQNVSLQLLDGSSTSYSAIKAGDANQAKDTVPLALPAGGETLNLPYAVEYFADGKATAGAVTSSVVYNLQYQ